MTVKWRCVVIDDEKPARDRIKRLLTTHADFDLVGEAGDAAKAVRLIDEVEPDVCFLDVRMPEGSGFDVVRQVEHAVHVVFTTAYDEYAVRAFEINSVDYLLKPFTQARFEAALQRVRQELCRSPGRPQPLTSILEALARPRPTLNPPPRITAKRGAKIVVLTPAEILWFEAEETLVFARSRAGRFLVERTLTDLEQLMGAGFFRSHRRYVVNLAQIREILPGDAGTYEIVVRDEPDERVPLSRRQARKLRELIPW